MAVYLTAVAFILFKATSLLGCLPPDIVPHPRPIEEIVEEGTIKPIDPNDYLYPDRPH